VRSSVPPQPVSAMVCVAELVAEAIGL